MRGRSTQGIRRSRRGVAIALSSICLLAVSTASGQEADQATEPVWRFPVGERAVYDVAFGPVKIGQGKLVVEAIDTVGATEAYRVAFELAGGPFFYKVDDRQVSWVAPDPIRSLRFEQRLREGGYSRNRRYELDQRSGTYSRHDWDEESGSFQLVAGEAAVPMPQNALDEIAYLYLTRSIPLEPGGTYNSSRYFEADGNPVRLEVLRRETVRVPAGRFSTIVVRPIIQAGGMFGEGGRAEVYLTDDDRRMIVRLKTTMEVGELNMYLRSYDPGVAEGFIGAGP